MSDQPTRLQDLEPLTEAEWLVIAQMLARGLEHKEEEAHEDETA